MAAVGRAGGWAAEAGPRRRCHPLTFRPLPAPSPPPVSCSPKINHYLQYMESGQCGRFGGLCEQGYRYGGVCAHAAEYAALAPDWQVAVQLDGLCRKLQAGEWRWPWGGPEADLWGTAPS